MPRSYHGHLLTFFQLINSLFFDTFLWEPVITINNLFFTLETFLFTKLFFLLIVSSKQLSIKIFHFFKNRINDIFLIEANQLSYLRLINQYLRTGKSSIRRVSITTWLNCCSFFRKIFKTIVNSNTIHI